MARGTEETDLFAAAPLPVAPLDDKQRLACLRLIRSENVGPATFRALINTYGGATAALAALPDLAKRGGRTIRICPEGDALRELEAARRIGAVPLFTIEPGYPAVMAFLEQAPPMIYARGDTRLLNSAALAVIGSRRASAAGIKLTRLLASAAGDAGIVVVSGLARGIDAAAHEAALATGTVAVLAGGLDIVYPPEHKALQEQIAERGCLISERPPGLEPKARDFPRRNRIISGISYGVLVIEAAQRSGTLITARFAAEQGREVLAVPGHPLDPRAEGTNSLLKGGATLVTDGADVVDAFRHIMVPGAVAGRLQAKTFEPGGGRGGAWHEPAMDGAPAPMPSPAGGADPTAETDERQRIIALLGPAPINADELARSALVPIQKVQIVLLELALAGRLEHHGNQLVSLRDDGP